MAPFRKLIFYAGRLSINYSYILGKYVKYFSFVVMKTPMCFTQKTRFRGNAIYCR